MLNIYFKIYVFIKKHEISLYEPKNKVYDVTFVILELV